MITTRAGPQDEPQDEPQDCAGYRRSWGDANGRSIGESAWGGRSRGMQECGDRSAPVPGRCPSARSSPGRSDTLSACPQQAWWFGSGSAAMACQAGLRGGRADGERHQAADRGLVIADLHRAPGLRQGGRGVARGPAAPDGAVSESGERLPLAAACLLQATRRSWWRPEVLTAPAQRGRRPLLAGLGSGDGEGSRARIIVVWVLPHYAGLPCGGTRACGGGWRRWQGSLR